MALGRLDEAEDRLLDAFELQEPTLGRTHRHTRKTVSALVDLYGVWRHPEKAAAWADRSARGEGGGAEAESQDGTTTPSAQGLSQ